MPQVSYRGLLPGILRGNLCEAEDVEETNIYVQDLKQYQECFVTILMGIMPVRQIRGEFGLRKTIDKGADENIRTWYRRR